MTETNDEIIASKMLAKFKELKKSNPDKILVDVELMLGLLDYVRKIDYDEYAVMNYIHSIHDCLGIDPTPEQFIEICGKINFPTNNLNEWGFGDTMDRDSFMKDFAIKVLGHTEIPSYGYGFTEEDMEDYWEALHKKAKAKGYKTTTRET